VRRTLARAEKELRAALGRASVHVKPLRQNYAHVRLDQNPARIVLDPHCGGLIENLVHELIHLTYTKELETWGSLEEPIVVALEIALVSYINKSETRLAWWRQRIEEAQED
jgi:CYTH domain-containing protein